MLMLSMSNFLFLLMLILSIILSSSTNSMLWMWFFMEVNTMMILPIFIINNSIFNVEQLMKFFIIQSISSNFLLMFVMMTKINMNFKSNTFFILIILSIMFKMGLAPLHMWLLKFVSFLKWMSLFLFLTIQKVIPILFLIMMWKSNLMILFIMLNSLFGSIMGLNQYSLRKILVFSSMNHMSWMFFSLFSSFKLFKIYFFLYTFMNFYICMIMKKMNMNYIFQSFMLKQEMKTQKTFSNMLIFKIMLFFMGLPPLLGFIPKILIIFKSNNNYTTMILFMIMLNLFSIMFYMRVMMSFSMNSNLLNKPIMIKVEFTNLKNSSIYMINLLIMLFLLHKLF